MGAKMKQLRIDFSDYPAEQQERDVERHAYLQKKYQPHIFFIKFDGIWATMTFAGGINHTFYEGKNLYQTFNAVKEKYPHHKMKYIINKGLEDYLRDVRKKEHAAKAKQLSIDFSKER